MWRRSLRRPGLAGLPAASQVSRACPPFQARVVKPRISTLTPQRSSVRARISAQQAATMIGRPRMLPELSSSSVTTVSRKIRVALVLEGQRMHRVGDDAGEAGGVERAFLEVEIPGAALLRHQLALQAVGQTRHGTLQVAQLLVEEGAQALQLVGRRQVLGARFPRRGRG